MAKEQGRITTEHVVGMFDLHRTTKEKYSRIAAVFDVTSAQSSIAC